MKVTQLASMEHDAAKAAIQAEAVSLADLIDLRLELDCRLRKTRATLRKLGRKCRQDESEANVAAYDGALDHLEAWQDLMGIVQSEQARRKAVSRDAHSAKVEANANPDFFKNFYHAAKDMLREPNFHAIRLAAGNAETLEKPLTDATPQA